MNTLNGHAAWVFTYQIARQTIPCGASAPKTASLLRPTVESFGLTGKRGPAPLSFRRNGYPERFSNANRRSADGLRERSVCRRHAFALPLAATIATRQLGEDLRRNVLQFRNCHKFRAKTPCCSMRRRASSRAPLPGETGVPQELLRQLEEDNQIYTILREDAVARMPPACKSSRRWT